MKIRSPSAVMLLCLAAPTFSGCAHNIVRASSPSVTAVPPGEPRTTASSEPVPEPVPAPELPQPEPVPELTPAPRSEPAPPRPTPAAAPVEAEAPRPVPAVAPPQISPVLTAADQQRLTSLATEQIRVAERNLQLSAGRRLTAAQADLAEKVRGFLSQAHEAVRANDWVRAQNLAEKAQVLSADLVKSF
jgi:outer membrane biosynthesis protein TonB